MNAQWVRPRRLSASAETDGLVYTMAVSVGCKCDGLLKAIASRVIGLVYDFETPFSPRKVGPVAGGKIKARMSMGDHRITHCPFCGSRLRLGRPTLTISKGK